VVLTAGDVGAYTKPAGGIPSTDLASAVQTSLGKADSALQTAPVTSVNGHTGVVTITASDVGLSNAYIKPGTGIPASDLATAVQTSLGKADSALQTAPVTSVNGHTGVVTVSKSDVGLGNVQNLAVLVLGPSDPVPGGTPAGTVILRTT